MVFRKGAIYLCQEIAMSHNHKNNHVTFTIDNMLTEL